jgi:glycosyltransferase involved in cell wall biosynthesis
VEAFRAAYPDRVEYHGHVDNRVLGAALVGRPFVFVHPGLWFEAFGRAVAEAMALGIPVIVPDVGGPAWIVEDGVSGVHYAHRDADDLARKIEWAAVHPSELERLASMGRRAVARFDYRTVAGQWAEILGEIAHRRVAHA